MKSRALLATIILVVLFMIPTMVSAAFVHYFDCQECHRAGADWTEVGPNGVCIGCHDADGQAYTFAKPRPDDGAVGATAKPGFTVADASNAFGNNVGATVQNSHNWGANDRNPAAGASPASTAMYNTRNNASRGYVTCSKCHDPHAYVDADYGLNEKMLRTQPSGYPLNTGLGDGTSTNSEQNVEAMCVECHTNWSAAGAYGVASARGFMSHPIDVADYETLAAGDPRFITFTPPPITADGNQMKLLAGNKIGCSTCHGTHNTSSGGANDGKLLKGPGASVNDTAVCTACHVYQAHPSSSLPPKNLGCLVCHSGHSYNDGTPNYFVLRSEVNVPAGVSLATAGTTVSGLRYNSATDPDANFATYCTGCHGLITDTAAGMPSEIRQHVLGEDCSQCHKHFDPANPTDPSWVGKGCDGCHGYPPTDAAAGNGINAGYANDPTGTGHDYSVFAKNGGITFRDESLTPHGSHASTNPVMANIDCKVCHNAHVTAFATQHNNSSTGPTFQNVLEGAYAISTLVSDGVNLAPSYNGTTTNCSAVYCHSNGTATPTAQVVTWASGNSTITGCAACHDDAGSGIGAQGATQKNNSAAHVKHVAKGYSCNVCHSDTATSGAAVNIAGGKHIDGNVQLAFDTTFDLDLGTGIALLSGSLASPGNCTVYCHSNGGSTSNPTVVNSAPNWAVPGSGACGTCHQVVSGDTSTPLGNAHTRHVFDADGPGLACTVCHTNNGTGAEHVNGEPSMIATLTTVCNTCHGATVGGTLSDAEPVWSTPGSVTCATCHTGTAISSLGIYSVTSGAGTYMDVATFYTTGHGDATLIAAPDCTGCHDPAAAGHFNGDSADDRLLLAAASNDAFCATCHGAQNSHFADANTAGGGSTDGNACSICHEPHGKGMTALGNTDVMLTVGKNFTNKLAPASYFNAAGNDGVCQVCHVATDGSGGSINHYNQTVAPDGHNATTVCTSCHSHGSSPVAFVAGCTDCHGNTTTGNFWPDNTAEHGIAWPNRLGSHDIHLTKIAKQKFATATPTAAQKNTTCDYCHVGGGHSGDQVSAPADLGGFKNILGVANVQTASVTQVAGNVSCSTVDCHYTTPTVAADWYSATKETSANCSYCHVSSATYLLGTLPNAHDKHMGELTDNGRNMVCTQCHLTQTDGAHQNGVIDFATSVAPLETTLTIAAAKTVGTKLGPKYAAAAAVAAEFSSCASLNCHGNFTGGNSANAPNWFNTDAQITGLNNGDGACGTCHAASPTTTGEHGAHIANSIFVPNSCVDCHGTGSTTGTHATHVDGTKDVNGLGQIITYTATNGTCANNCHTVTEGNDWTSGTGLKCTDCHDNALTWAPGGNALTKGWPGGTKAVSVGDAAHDAHVANTSYVTGANCVDCHNDNSTVSGHSLLNGTATSPILGAKVSDYTLTSGTCTNTCHGGIADFTDSAPSPVCIDCHSGAYVGGGTKAPVSGLHNTTNLTDHDSTLTGGTGNACEKCHTASPSASHVNGTLDKPVTWNATNIPAGYDSVSDSCAAACHTDGGDWNRKWAGVTDAVLTGAPGAAVCGNCHGDFTNGWRSVNVNHTNPYTGNDVAYGGGGDAMGEHSVCKTCHGWGDTGYNTTYLGSSAVGYVGHGDLHITMNGPSGIGAGYNNTSGGCTVACHTETPFVMDTNSGWTANYADFGSGDCIGCHTANGVRHSSTNESLALHNAHNASPYIDTNIAFDAAVAATFDNCTTCHPHNGTLSATHPDGTVNFASGITAPASYLVASGFPDTGCTTTCHIGETGEWLSGNLNTTATTGACASCHAGGGSLDQGGYPPTSAKHAKHIASNNYVPNDCNDCHGTGATTGAHTGHLDKIKTNVVSYVTATQTCTNACHVADTTGDWTTGGALACTDCHNTVAAKTLNAGDSAWTATGKDGAHGTHAAQGPTAAVYAASGQSASGAGEVYEFGCAVCHPGTHLNGTNFPVLTTDREISNAIGWSNGTSSCSTNFCHNQGDAFLTPPLLNGAGNLVWGTPFSGDRCNKCHDNIPNTNAHSVHQIGIHTEDIYTGTSGLLSAGAEPSSHGGLTTGGVPTSTVINCQVCHINTVTDWNNDLNPTCSVASCHDTGTRLKGAVTIANRANHIDNHLVAPRAEVSFFNSPVRSKAQLRNDIESTTEIGSNWDRYNNGALTPGSYKVANAYDQTTQNLSIGGTFTLGAASSQSTCTTQCHNGNAATWSTPTGDCSACHTQLPQ